VRFTNGKRGSLCSNMSKQSKKSMGSIDEQVSLQISGGWEAQDETASERDLTLSEEEVKELGVTPGKVKKDGGIFLF